MQGSTSKEAIKRIETELSDGRIMKWKDLSKIDGVNSSVVASMLRRSLITRVGWGAYQLSDERRQELSFGIEKDPCEDDSAYLENFSEVTARAPKAIVSLLSALVYHELSVEVPHEVWVSFPHGSKAPKIDYPPIKPVFWRNKETHTLGVDHVSYNGMEVPITNVERTIVDLYRYQNRLADPNLPGRVLAEAVQKSKVNRDRIHDYADQMGVLQKLRKDLEIIDLAMSGPQESMMVM